MKASPQLRLPVYLVSLLLLLSTGVPSGWSQTRDRLVPYTPGQKLTGPIILHSWGSKEMADLMIAWESGFMRYQPESCDELSSMECDQV